MRKETAFGIIILMVLLSVSRTASAGDISHNRTLSLNCGHFTVKGTWTSYSGPDVIVEGRCAVTFVNPTNTTIKYSFTYWKKLNVIPRGVDFGYQFLKLPERWIKPGEVVVYNLSMKGEVKGITDVLKLIEEGKISIVGTGEFWMETREKTSKHIPFSVDVVIPVKFEWYSVLLAVSAIVMPVVWFIFALLMGIVNRKDEAKAFGWAILASLGVVVVPFFGILTTLNLKAQLFTLLSIELAWLAMWLSLVNRTTPEKPEKVTELLGNAVLVFLGLSVFTAVLGGYTEGSSALTGGIIFLVVLLVGIMKDSLGEKEKRGKVPRIEPFPFGLALLFLSYPSLADLLLGGWREGFVIMSFATLLLLALGTWFVRKAKSGREVQSV
ncbi:hypothetical protein [Thermococcus sp.]|uniref:hypothetical protein n=1 Tax=Thermococcus sp. TaxID=35749 RepID=UPI0026197C93|nr:hypothetical protein [Thermococcus sp.]